MMVCPYDDSRVLLILQTDHSRIAGLLASHWGNDQFAKLQPYSSMVLAAQEHDSGWWDWEIKPSVNEQGYPSDYIGSIKHLGHGVWLDLYRHAIERVAARDLYAAYFVSMHGEALLTKGMGLLPSMPDYAGDAVVQKFIAEQKGLRAGWLPTLKKTQHLADLTTEKHLWTNFNLMEVFDQFAQFVCNRYPFNSQARKNGPTHTLSGISVPVSPERSESHFDDRRSKRNRRSSASIPIRRESSEAILRGPARAQPAFRRSRGFLREFSTAVRGSPSTIR
jgi:hypothetical protein